MVTPAISHLQSALSVKILSNHQENKQLQVMTTILVNFSIMSLNPADRTIFLKTKQNFWLPKHLMTCSFKPRIMLFTKTFIQVYIHFFVCQVFHMYLMFHFYSLNSTTVTFWIKVMFSNHVKIPIVLEIHD